MTSKIKIRIAAYTDPAGKWNENAPNSGNEDNMFIDADLKDEMSGSFVPDAEIDLHEYGCLLAVADGMGGMNAGEVASAIAIDVVKQHFTPDRLSGAVVSSAASRAEYMERVVTAADEEIKSEAKNNQACEGMGSTIVMAWMYGGEVTVTWCGDSRAYLFRPSSGLSRISKDHSYVQQLVDAGKITDDEAFDHPYNNIITRSLGDPENRARADSRTIDVYEGDIVLVCSDGLSGVLKDNEMETIIRDSRETLSGCRKALWAAAEPNWYDNVTAILCEVTSGKAEPASADMKPNSERSFISMKVSKRALKVTCAAFLAVLVAVCAYFFIPRYWHQGRGGIRQHANSLAKVADGAGLAFLSDSLRSLPLKDTAALKRLEGELVRRLELLSRIDTFKCPEEFTAMRQRISGLRKDVLDPDTASEKIAGEITDVTESLKCMDKILSEMDRLLSEGRIDKLAETEVKLFRQKLTQKNNIGRKELDAWNKLKKRILRSVNRHGGTHAEQSNPAQSLPDASSPSTPDTDTTSAKRLVPVMGTK